MLTTIIVRGHSGTRAISHTLSASGVWMGEPLNGSEDPRDYSDLSLDRQDVPGCQVHFLDP